MSVLGSAPRGSCRRLTRASTGTRRRNGLRDGPGAAAAGAPTAGRRRLARWPRKPPLLGHAQLSAAPVPPAARVGRDPAPGESGRPPRRGARAAPGARPDPAAPGRGGRGRPNWEDVSSWCAQLRAGVSDGAAAARAAPALPTDRLPQPDSCPTGQQAPNVDGARPEVLTPGSREWSREAGHGANHITCINSHQPFQEDVSETIKIMIPSNSIKA
ncbi:uncharacterized protein [Chlorocebus sabaeus]|uniref:uncharacterized protein n=1 Tax=Chlorocebus sabaeus TaxID=60711 RepID=UPI00045DFC7D|nr:translation initiation factor IF-2-like [Chlorocebus sabaeus]XP_007967417.1 translation initiation factor IF-2-like [Chlorocebus sabaeus]